MNVSSSNHEWRIARCLLCFIMKMTTLQHILTVDDSHVLYCDIYIVPKKCAKTGKETCSWFQRKQWKEVQSLLIPPLQQNIRNDDVSRFSTEEIKFIKDSLEITCSIESSKNEFGIILSPIKDGKLWEKAWYTCGGKKDFNNFGGMFTQKTILKNRLYVYVKYVEAEDNLINTIQVEKVKKSSYFKEISSMHTSTPDEKSSIRRIVHQVKKSRRCKKGEKQHQRISSFLKVNKVKENIHSVSSSCLSTHAADIDTLAFVSHKEDCIPTSKNSVLPDCTSVNALKLNPVILSDEHNKTNLCEENLDFLSSESTIFETSTCSTDSNETAMKSFPRASPHSAKLVTSELKFYEYNSTDHKERLSAGSNCKQRLKLRKQSKPIGSRLSRRQQVKDPIKHSFDKQSSEQCLESVQSVPLAAHKKAHKKSKKCTNIKHSLHSPDSKVGCRLKIDKETKLENLGMEPSKHIPLSNIRKSNNTYSSQENDLSCQSNFMESLSRSLTKSRIAAALEMRGYGQKEAKQVCEGDQGTPFHDGDEELDKSQIEKELRRIKHLHKLQKSHLKYLFHEKLPYLMDIFKEKTFCRRHTDFMKGGKANVSLTYQVYALLFTDEQIDYLMEKLIDVFCKNNLQDIDYILKVLLPELLICIYMSLAGTNHDESDELMARGLFKKH